jgi:hypothetical protein
MSPMAARRSLANLARSGDAQALRTTLETDPALGVVLGVAASGVRDLLENGDDQLVPAVDELLRRQRCSDAVARQLRAHRLSLEAAAEVADTARWLDDRAFLDRRLVLGPLLSHLTHVLFDVDGTDMAIGVPLLRRAARATRPFVDVSVSVDRSGLYVRWRGGRGGLTFRPELLDSVEHRRAVRVVLVRPAIPEPRPVLHGGAWIREVLEEVGTFF